MKCDEFISSLFIIDLQQLIDMPSLHCQKLETGDYKQYSRVDRKVGRFGVDHGTASGFSAEQLTLAQVVRSPSRPQKMKLTSVECSLARGGWSLGSGTAVLKH